MLENYIEEIDYIKEHSKGTTLPRLMLQYHALMKHRLSWRIDDEVSREDLFKMEERVLNYLRGLYIKK